MSKTRVISDLHIGAGPLDDCDAELEAGLCAFLRHFAADGGGELVIAGDFFDFAQAPPAEGKELEATSASGVPLCFTEKQSLAKLCEILASHRSVWEALREFLGSDGENRLVIMPGNHDADFFWRSVRDGFTEAVVRGDSALGARVAFHLEAVYRPTAAPSTWIEHGHQYDPLNSFNLRDGTPRWSVDMPPILDGADGTPRLIECIGTRFMVRFMNRLDALYPFVDNVKPFYRFLTLFGASIFATGRGPKAAALAILALLRFTGNTEVRRVGDLLSLEGASDREISLPNLIRRGFGDEERRILQQRLEAAGFDLDRPLDMLADNPARADALVDFLLDRLDLLDGIDEPDASDLLGHEEGTLALGRELLFGDETKRLNLAAREILGRGDATRVVMGHTHESVGQGNASAYLNAGCWTRYYTFDSGERTQPFRVLRDGGYAEFPYRLQYVDIAEAGEAASIELFKERMKP